MAFPLPKALKSSKEVELVEDKIRCRVDPERWPIPAPPVVGSPRTDFSQLINCPEFVPRQTLGAASSGPCSLAQKPKPAAPPLVLDGQNSPERYLRSSLIRLTSVI